MLSLQVNNFRGPPFNLQGGGGGADWSFCRGFFYSNPARRRAEKFQIVLHAHIEQLFISRKGPLNFFYFKTTAPPPLRIKYLPPTLMSLCEMNVMWCKGKQQYLLTWKVGWYCCLPLPFRIYCCNRGHLDNATRRTPVSRSLHPGIITRIQKWGLIVHLMNDRKAKWSPPANYRYWRNDEPRLARQTNLDESACDRCRLVGTWQGGPVAGGGPRVHPGWWPLPTWPRSVMAYWAHASLFQRQHVSGQHPAVMETGHRAKTTGSNCSLSK